MMMMIDLEPIFLIRPRYKTPKLVKDKDFWFVVLV